MTLTRGRYSLLSLLYMFVGVAMAGSHHYFDNIDSIRTFGSAVLAILLWPLVLIGINLHIHR